MKIIILTVDHLYSNVVIKELIKNFGDDIKLVVMSGVILHNSSFISSIRKYFNTSGIYYFLAQTIKLELYKILKLLIKNQHSKFYSYRHLLAVKKIPLKIIHDINGSFVADLKKNKPDLIISVFFNQLLTPEVIKLSKKGAINIHPGYLPDYKGVSPIFWALVNGEKFGGVSIHYINEGIDTGGIIARKKIFISKNDGEDSLYLKSATAGIDLLVKAINDIKKGPVKTIKNSGCRYFSLPTKKAVKKFKKNGRNFFSLKEYIFN